MPVFFPADPDTAPGAIEDLHRCEVAEYVATHPDASAREIGEALCLPTWNVRRALAHLRGEPSPWRKAPIPAGADLTTPGGAWPVRVRKARFGTPPGGRE